LPEFAVIICGTAEHSTAERGPRGGALVTRAHGAAGRYVHPTEQTVAEPATPLHGETTSDVTYRVGYLQFGMKVVIADNDVADLESAAERLDARSPTTEYTNSSIPRALDTADAP
jgi:hypothetical protein